MIMSDEKQPSKLSTKVDKKRKRQTVETEANNKKEENEQSIKESEVLPSDATTATTRQDKKRQRRKAYREKSKLKKQFLSNGDDDDEKDMLKDEGIDPSVSQMDGRLLSDYFAQRARKFNQQLTPMELEDVSVPESAFLDTTSFAKRRGMDQLPEFTKTFTPPSKDLSDAAEESGSPHTIVVTASGIRAVDLVR